jgi:hypothetical protein
VGVGGKPTRTAGACSAEERKRRGSFAGVVSRGLPVRAGIGLGVWPCRLGGLGLRFVVSVVVVGDGEAAASPGLGTRPCGVGVWLLQSSVFGDAAGG